MDKHCILDLCYPLYLDHKCAQRKSNNLPERQTMVFSNFCIGRSYYGLTDCFWRMKPASNIHIFDPYYCRWECWLADRRPHEIFLASLHYGNIKKLVLLGTVQLWLPGWKPMSLFWKTHVWIPHTGYTIIVDFVLFFHITKMVDKENLRLRNIQGKRKA